MFWKEEPFEFEGIQGTKYSWPKDRPVVFRNRNDDREIGGIPHPGASWLPTFSLLHNRVSETTLEGNLKAAVANYVKLETVWADGISLGGMPSNEELRAPGGMLKYFEWLERGVPAFDKSKLHIHLIEIDGVDELAIAIWDRKGEPLTNFYRI